LSNIANVESGIFIEKTEPLVRNDSQDTLNENLEDIDSKRDLFLELKSGTDMQAGVDLHIEYTEYINRNTKKISQDWQANSLEAFHSL
jgi:hypothetical protein